MVVTGLQYVSIASRLIIYSSHFVVYIPYVRYDAIAYSFARLLGRVTVTSFSKLSFVCTFIATLLRECLSTKTWVYPPTAAGTSTLLDVPDVSSPPKDLNTPTSYVTELLPSCATLRPKSRTSGNDRGEKN